MPIVEVAPDKKTTVFYGGMEESTKGQKYELPELSTRSQDAMVNLFTSIIFTVTCYHSNFLYRNHLCHLLKGSSTYHAYSCVPLY